MEIRPVDDEVYTDVQSLADELPEHAPRFVLLSYPLTLVCSLSLSLSLDVLGGSGDVEYGGAD